MILYRPLQFLNLLLLLSIMLINLSGCASRRQIIRSDRYDHGDTPSSPPYHEMTDVEVREVEQKNANNTFAENKEPGWHTQQYSSSTPVSDFFVDVFTGANRNNDNILIIKFLCDIPEALVAIDYKYKTIKWSFINHPEIKKEMQSGISRTDADGFLRFRLSTNSETGYLEITIKDFSKRISLSSGPFEIRIPEKICESTT